MIDLSARSHPSGDLLLSILCNVPGSIGTLVNAFPGPNSLESDPNWLDTWFKAELATPSGQLTDDITLQDLTDEIIRSVRLRKVSLSEPVKLTSLSLHYFRGFRAFEAPINLDSALVVL